MLHEATKAYIIWLLEDTNLCMIHAKQITILPRDMQLAQRIRGKLLCQVIHHHSLFCQSRKRSCSAIIIGFIGDTVISSFQGTSSFHKNNG